MVAAKGAMPSAPVDANEQPSLRVMRLYKPRLNTRTALPVCAAGNSRSLSTAGATPMMATPEVDSIANGEDDFALKSALKLPDNFGNIYLGETFTAYIRWELPDIK